MSRDKMKINIDHLQIRLRGVSPQTARAAAANIGHDVMRQLAAGRIARAPHMAGVAHLDAGSVSFNAGTDAARLSRVIAGRIALALEERFSR